MGNKRKTEEEFTRDFNLIVKDTGKAGGEHLHSIEKMKYFKKFTLYTNDSKCITSYNL